MVLEHNVLTLRRAGAHEARHPAVGLAQARMAQSDYRILGLSLSHRLLRCRVTAQRTSSMCKQQAPFNAASVVREAVGSVDAYVRRREIDSSLIVVGASDARAMTMPPTETSASALRWAGLSALAGQGRPRFIQ